MKRLMIVFFAVVCITLQGTAQTEENETKVQKFFRLTKEADDNPKDWKAQLEAGRFLLDKENGMYNMSQAEKYYDRLYHLATDYNKEIPDSVIREAGVMLMTVASDKKNVDKALFYADEMLRIEKMGVTLEDSYFFSFSMAGWMYNMLKGDDPRALVHMMAMRDRLAQKNLQGVEHMDVTTMMLFESLMYKYREMFGDKLIEMVTDGKKYILIGEGDWNIEKPFMGWTLGGKGGVTLVCDEDGKVHDDIHGVMEYGFNYSKEGMVAKEGTNMRLITVTPERRQQLVDAYRKYMKKSKNKK